MHTKPPLHRLPSHGPSRKRSAVCPSLAGLQQRGFLRTPRVPASPTPPAPGDVCIGSTLPASA